MQRKHAHSQHAGTAREMMDIASFSLCIQIVWFRIFVVALNAEANEANREPPKMLAIYDCIVMHSSPSPTYFGTFKRLPQKVDAVCFAFRPKYGAAYQITKIRYCTVLSVCVLCAEMKWNASSMSRNNVVRLWIHSACTDAGPRSGYCSVFWSHLSACSTHTHTSGYDIFANMWRTMPMHSRWWTDAVERSAEWVLRTYCERS